MTYQSLLKLLLTFYAFALLPACKPQAEVEQRPPVARLVRSVVATPQPITPNLTFSGEIKARYESKLGFRVGGKIIDRRVDIGDHVEPGDVLFRVDDKDLTLAQEAASAALNQARAERSLAQQNYTRFEELKQRGLISSADFDQHATVLRSAREQVQVAEAQLDQAKNKSGYSVLYADQAGVITDIQAEIGQVVQAGQTVACLERAGALEVEFSVPEQQRELIKPQAEAKIQLWAEPDKLYMAMLREISPTADPLTRTYRIRMEIDNPDNALKPGMTATVELAIASRSTLLLPLSALATKSSKPQVWRINSDSLTVEPVWVSTGALIDNNIEITAGINAGERVVTAGANLLTPGQRVRLLEQE